MEEKKHMLTQEGYDRLAAELDDLQIRGRAEVSEKLSIARSYGDLSENAEYDAAKEAQVQIEQRIDELTEILKNYVIIDEDTLSTDTVSVSHIVQIQDTDTGEKHEFKIVGSTESDPLEGKISNESPVGRALLGRKTGEIVEVDIPDGMKRYKVLSIRREDRKEA